jgi:anti-sigma factor RsiW
LSDRLHRRAAWRALREHASRLRSLLALRHAMPFVTGAVLGMLIMSMVMATDRGEAIGREAVASHVRSLADGHVADIASADPDVLTSWFQGRLHYSPGVGDLSAAGYALAGARVDYIGDRTVAAVVYLQGRHFINLFSCPLQAGRVFDGVLHRAGFTALGWSDDSRQYWAVSDLDAAQLRAYASALGGQRDGRRMH